MSWKKIEPKVWKPENPEDKIIGVLIAKEASKYQGTTNYSLEVKIGEITDNVLVYGSTVLDDRMRVIQPGQMIKIIYKGTQQNQSGNPTKIFEVFVSDNEPKPKESPPSYV